MRLSAAVETIAASHGYLVHFERIKGRMLVGDYFPEVRKGEEPFKTQEEAIEMGVKYAKATRGSTCNFYLIRSDTFSPVGSWKLANRPEL